MLEMKVRQTLRSAYVVGNHCIMEGVPRVCSERLYTTNIVHVFSLRPLCSPVIMCCLEMFGAITLNCGADLTLPLSPVFSLRMTNTACII